MEETATLRNIFDNIVKRREGSKLFESFMLVLYFIETYVRKTSATIPQFAQDNQLPAPEFKNKDTNKIRILLQVWHNLKDISANDLQKYASDPKYTLDMINHAKDQVQHREDTETDILNDQVIALMNNLLKRAEKIKSESDETLNQSSEIEKQVQDLKRRVETYITPKPQLHL